MAVFYRKYRPQKLSDIFGQEQIKKTLMAQLEGGKISHGYLFAGPRGTGKTSVARIFAKAVNCNSFDVKRKGSILKFGEPCNKCVSCKAIADASHLDLIEIDAASNRGIDEIRDLREKIKLSPVSSRFKVYIIDEAHMLTTEAFNALLKTLEEPPAHAIFILCTTDPNKLPKTIISRLSRFNFTRASDDENVAYLKKIAKSENIKIDDEALFVIAKSSDGAFRDAASMLDQLAASGRKITVQDAKNLASALDFGNLVEFLESIGKKDVKKSVDFVERYVNDGGDVSTLIHDSIFILEKLLLLKISSGFFEEEDFDEKQKRRLEELGNNMSYVDVQNLMKLFLIADGEIKMYPMPKISLILAVCKFCGEVKESRKDTKTEEELDDGGGAETKKSVVSTEKKELSKKTAGVKNANVDLAEVEKNWNKFLSKVRPVNAHLVALLRSTRPVDFNDANLTLEVFYKFHKEKLEEPKITRMLEGFLAEVFGGDIKLRTALAQRDAKKPKPVEKSDVVDVSGDDLSDLASEIFSK